VFGNETRARSMAEKSDIVLELAGTPTSRYLSSICQRTAGSAHSRDALGFASLLRDAI
jgi:hypothetical protein